MKHLILIAVIACSFSAKAAEKYFPILDCKQTAQVEKGPASVRIFWRGDNLEAHSGGFFNNTVSALKFAEDQSLFDQGRQRYLGAGIELQTIRGAPGYGIKAQWIEPDLKSL